MSAYSDLAIKLCILLSTASTLCPAGAASADEPNFLVVLIDDLGWTDTSVQMDPNIPKSKSDFHQTPNLEALAAAGMKFSNAYASSPNCSPTRASIQTGKTPARLGMTDILQGGEVNSIRRVAQYHDRPLVPPVPLNQLPNEEVTIAEQLKAGNTKLSD